MWYRNVYKHFGTHSSFSATPQMSTKSSRKDTFGRNRRHDPVTRPIVLVTSATRLYSPVSTPKNTNRRSGALAVHFFLRAHLIPVRWRLAKWQKIAGKGLVEIYMCHVTHFPSVNCSYWIFSFSPRLLHTLLARHTRRSLHANAPLASH